MLRADASAQVKLIKADGGRSVTDTVRYVLDAPAHDGSDERYAVARGVGMVATDSKGACEEFYSDLARWDKRGLKNECHHLEVSFSPGAFDPDDTEDLQQANAITRAFVERAFPGRKALVVTQKDGTAGLVHNHVVLANIDDHGRAARGDTMRWTRFSKVHDEVLAEAGIMQSAMPAPGAAPEFREQRYRHGGDRIKQLMADVRAARDASTSQVEFEALMAAHGVQVVVSPPDDGHQHTRVRYQGVDDQGTEFDYAASTLGRGAGAKALTDAFEANRAKVATAPATTRARVPRATKVPAPAKVERFQRVEFVPPEFAPVNSFGEPVEASTVHWSERMRFDQQVARDRAAHEAEQDRLEFEWLLSHGEVDLDQVARDIIDEAREEGTVAEVLSSMTSTVMPRKDGGTWVLRELDVHGHKVRVGKGLGEGYDAVTLAREAVAEMAPAELRAAVVHEDVTGDDGKVYRAHKVKVGALTASLKSAGTSWPEVSRAIANDAIADAMATLPPAQRRAFLDGKVSHQGVELVRGEFTTTDGEQRTYVRVRVDGEDGPSLASLGEGFSMRDLRSQVDEPWRSQAREVLATITKDGRSVNWRASDEVARELGWMVARVPIIDHKTGEVRVDEEGDIVTGWGIAKVGDDGEVVNAMPLAGVIDAEERSEFEDLMSGHKERAKLKREEFYEKLREVNKEATAKRFDELRKERAERYRQRGAEERARRRAGRMRIKRGKSVAGRLAQQLAEMDEDGSMGMSMVVGMLLAVEVGVQAGRMVARKADQFLYDHGNKVDAKRRQRDKADEIAQDKELRKAEWAAEKAEREAERKVAAEVRADKAFEDDLTMAGSVSAGGQDLDKAELAQMLKEGQAKRARDRDDQQKSRVATERVRQSVSRTDQEEQAAAWEQAQAAKKAGQHASSVWDTADLGRWRQDPGGSRGADGPEMGG